MEIRRLTDADGQAVLDLNEMSVTLTGPLDGESLASNVAIASEALICEIDGTVAAFAIAYAPGTAYGSANYRWHTARFDDFLYLDRIVVGADFRRRGIGTALYDALEQVARAHGRMVCEVNSEPPNHESLAFHHGRGYLDIGHLTHPDGHQVVMMEKPL